MNKMVIGQTTGVLELVVKENRKLLQERFRNVLTSADYLFERGYFSRADYHEIDDFDNAAQRCNKFLDILISKQDESLLDVFLDHLAELGRNQSRDGDVPLAEGPYGLKLLHEKLTLSREKYNPNPNSLKKWEPSGTDNKLDNPGIIDFSDFTLTQKCLEEICTTKILRNEKVKREWKRVISNMNGLQDVELLVYNGEDNGTDGDAFDDNSLKMRLRFKGEHQTIQNYIHCINWEEIAQKCFSLWKERNGINATFFSLVGIFQHSQLIGIADWLLENRDDIQKGIFR